MDGLLVRDSEAFRDVWPSELVLMGRVAGLRLAECWAGWDKAPFTADRTSQVAVFKRPA